LCQQVLSYRSVVVKRSPLPPRDQALSALVLVLCTLFSGSVWLSGVPEREWISGLPLLVGGAVSLNLGVIRRPFFPYDRILSAYSADGVEWRREPGVRLDVGGLHRSRMVYHPEVVWSAAGARMFYRAGDRDAFIGSAFSTDGLVWREEAQPRLEAGGRHHLLRLDGPKVVRQGAESWRIYYAGFDGSWWRIYTRRSGDLRSWEEEQCCLDLSGGERALHTIDPAVVAAEEGFWLYFLGFGDGQHRIWRALSAEGLVWRNPLPCAGYEEEGMVPRDPCVVRWGQGGWRMYFSEHPPASALGSRVVSAVSADGERWRREPGARVAPPGEYDRHGAFCPTVVPAGGGWRMYYGGYWGRHWLEPLTLLAQGRRPA
jgi:hypothetical protein